MNKIYIKLFHIIKRNLYQINIVMGAKRERARRRDSPARRVEKLKKNRKKSKKEKSRPRSRKGRNTWICVEITLSINDVWKKHEKYLRIFVKLEFSCFFCNLMSPWETRIGVYINCRKRMKFFRQSKHGEHKWHMNQISHESTISRAVKNVIFGEIW